MKHSLERIDYRVGVAGEAYRSRDKLECDLDDHRKPISDLPLRWLVSTVVQVLYTAMKEENWGLVAEATAMLQDAELRAREP